MQEKGHIVKFIWRITYAHVIAYFLAGIFAMAVMNYKDLFVTESLARLMKPTSAPIVALGGTSLQLFRGIILSLVIYPLRKAFFEEKHGYLKLGLIILGLSFLSTIGPAPGSFEGFIYTTIPAAYQLLGYPEALLYIFLFVGILNVANKFDNKKVVKILPVVFVSLIFAMGIIGYSSA